MLNIDESHFLFADGLSFVDVKQASCQCAKAKGMAARNIADGGAGER